MRLPATAHELVTAPLERSALGAARALLLKRANGRVLEIGAGTGVNLAFYPAAVTALDLCEPDPRLRRQLERRVASRTWPFPVTVQPSAGNGPFPPAGYDRVVSTFALCRAGEAEAAVSALRDAMGDGGRVLYLEHVHAGGLAGRLQTLVSPCWRRMPGGCRLDRPATAALRSAGLVPVEQRWIRLPPPLFLALAGEAVVRIRPPATRPPSPSLATVPL